MRPEGSAAVMPILSPRSLGRLPVAASLVPDPDVWRIAGVGRTLIARRRPDGRIAWASLVIDLKRPKELLLIGHLHSEEGEFEALLEGLCQIEGCAPMIGGNAPLAGRFAWGAYAYAEERELDFGGADQALMALFEKPGMRDEDSRRFFDGKDGVADRDLLAFCVREEKARLSPGVELATLVRMVFHAPHPEPLARALLRDGSFCTNGRRGTGLELDWAPLGTDGRAHPRGAIALRGARLGAEAVSLSHAARLCASLKRLSDGALELVDVKRTTVGDLERPALDQAG
jgi:hypothetical protein